MREIKYKAHNTRTGEVVIVTDLYWFEENGVHQNGDGLHGPWNLYEYIGLKDKNGVEIYEEDIALSYNIREDKPVPVKIILAHHIWATQTPDGAISGLARPSGEFGVEVIGSTYKNPELLKERT